MSDVSNTPSSSRSKLKRILKTVLHVAIFLALMWLWYVPLIMSPSVEGLDDLFTLHSSMIAEAIGYEGYEPKRGQFPILFAVVELVFNGLVIFALVRRSLLINGLLLVGTFSWMLVNLWIGLATHPYQS